MIKKAVTTFLTIIFLSENSYYSDIAFKDVKNLSPVNDLLVARSLNTEEQVFFTAPKKDILMEVKKEKELQNKIKQKEEAERLKAEIEKVTEINNQKNNVNFNPYNLTEVTYLTVDELNQIFISKNVPEMCQLTQAIIDAEAIYGVNALFLSGIAAQESGWGKKPAGNGTNLQDMLYIALITKENILHLHIRI